MVITRKPSFPRGVHTYDYPDSINTGGHVGGSYGIVTGKRTLRRVFTPIIPMAPILVGTLVVFTGL